MAGWVAGWLVGWLGESQVCMLVLSRAFVGGKRTRGEDLRTNYGRKQMNKKHGHLSAQILSQIHPPG